MVLLLHGCQQSGMDFAEESGFQAAADAEGFILVTPRQEMQHQLQRCWRWYDSSHQRRDSGEPAILTVITREVLAELRNGGSIRGGSMSPACPRAVRWR